jgi:hypothetical protein
VLAIDSPRGGELGLFVENAGGGTAMTTSWYLKGPLASQAGAIEPGWDKILAKYDGGGQ